jgi:hypothetical protein
MKGRFTLTAIWIVSFTLALIVIESYIVRLEGSQAVLLPDDRLDCLRPLIALYGSYLAGILGFWFARPFSPKPIPAAWRKRQFTIAVVCTVLFNAILLYLISQQYIAGNRIVVEDVGTAVTIAGLLSFIVAPVNAFYFGQKDK